MAPQNVHVKTLEPVNVTLFEKRVFANVIKDFKWDHLGISGKTLSPMTSVLLRDAQRTERRGGSKVTAEAEIAVLQPQATRSPSDKEQTKPPNSLKWRWTCHLDFGLLASRTVREWISIVRATQFGVSAYSSLQNKSRYLVQRVLDAPSIDTLSWLFLKASLFFLRCPPRPSSLAQPVWALEKAPPPGRHWGRGHLLQQFPAPQDPSFSLGSVATAFNICPVNKCFSNDHPHPGQYRAQQRVRIWRCLAFRELYNKPSH